MKEWQGKAERVVSLVVQVGAKVRLLWGGALPLIPLPPPYLEGEDAPLPALALASTLIDGWSFMKSMSRFHNA